MSLRSDHVNYLIWRYLQEYGYGRTAVQLMRDWGHDDPQDLPFAPFVPPHTLLSILRDGLIYDELLSTVEEDERRYQFTNEKKRKHSITLGSDAEGVRHDLDARKRVRMDADNANRLKTTPIEGRRQTVRDAHVDSYIAAPHSQHSVKRRGDPSNEDLGATRPESTLNAGFSKGVQSERPSDLMLAKKVCELSVPGSDIVHVSWDKKEPLDVLAAGASVCHRWKLPTSTSSIKIDEKAFPEAQALLPDGDPYFVTGLSRTAYGDNLAMAVEGGSYFEFERSELLISFPGEDAIPICKIPEPVLVLRWHPSQPLVIGASSSGNNGTLRLWNVISGSLLHAETTDRAILDVAWLDEDLLIVCGENLLQIYRAVHGLRLERTISTSNSWEMLRFSPGAMKAACSTTSDGQIGVVDTSTWALTTFAAHNEQVTQIDWQVLSKPDAVARDKILLASACINGEIKLWRFHGGLDCIQRLQVGSEIPAMAITFSSDGALIAAAGDRKVIVWKVGRSIRPVASWTSSDRLVNGHMVNGQLDSMSDDTKMLSHISLAWNCDSRYLAYASDDKVTIISITPCV